MRLEHEVKCVWDPFRLVHNDISYVGKCFLSWFVVRLVPSRGLGPRKVIASPWWMEIK